MEKSTKSDQTLTGHVERFSRSFVINLNEEEDENSTSKNHPKFSRNAQNVRESLTKEDLERKQQEVFERKQKFQKAKIARIQERSEDCRKVDEKVQILLQQDAVRRQLPGSETIKPLSRSEISKVVKGVAKDIELISNNLQSVDDVSIDPKS